MKYVLDKISYPGFTLITNHISEIERVLQDRICSTCKAEGDAVEQEGLTIDAKYFEELLENKDKLYIKDKKHRARFIPKENIEKLRIINTLIVEELLCTACGAEYWFEVYEDSEIDATEKETKIEYKLQIDKDFKAYNDMVKEGIFT